MKLREIIKSKTGLNSREMKKQNAVSYSIADFNYDLNQTFEEVSKLSNDDDLNRVALKQGDLIVSLQDFKMAIVSEKNAGKVFSQRFLRIIPKKESSLDIRYLLFIFNQSTLIQKQIHNMLEGTVLKLIKESNILNITIQLPSLEIQAKIGSYYQLLKEFENLTQEKLSLLDKLSMELLNNLNIEK